MELAAKTNVKICVSSRPWTAFQEAFETQAHSLRLEDLSRSDIQVFVSDKIRSVLRMKSELTGITLSEGVDDLIEEITAKAEGVFLWIVLIVRSVCEGTSNADTIDFLRYRVESVPSDLEDLFRSILERIEPIYVHQTNQTLKLAWLYAKSALSRAREDIVDVADEDPTETFCASSGVKQGKTLGAALTPEDCMTATRNTWSSFVDFWLITKNVTGLRNAKCVYRISVIELTNPETAHMVAATRRFLIASCKNLFYLPHWPGSGCDLFDSSYKVQLLHRTVFDSLNTPEMGTIINKKVLDTFINGDIIHLLDLARIQYVLPGDTLIARKAMIQDAINTSLSEQHSFHGPRYIHHVDIVLSDHRLKSTSTRLPEHYYTPAIDILISHHAHRTVSTILQRPTSSTLTDLNISHPVTADSHEHPIWLAALGCSSHRSFGLEEVELDLLRQIRRQSNDYRGHGSPHVQHQSCCSNAWQLFLRKWKETDPPTTESAECKAAVARYVWKVALLLLPFFGVWPDLEFCVDGELRSGNRRHFVVSTKEFLLRHVPEEWLLEAFFTIDLLNNDEQ